MNKLHIDRKYIKCVLIIMALLLVGCASSPKKDANKNLFQQALILQKGQMRQLEQAQVPVEIKWSFNKSQIKPHASQRQEFFLWLAQLESYENTPITLQLGPDWISSYKRGNVIREMIPRGIVIEQFYKSDLPSHEVILSYQENTKGAADDPQQ